MEELILKRIQESIELKKKLEKITNKIEIAGKILVECLRNKKKVLLCGNGGSSADAQHIAAELVGKFKIEDKKGLPAISLSTNTSVITALSNDFGYEFVFQKQVSALGTEGDCLIVLSTSGKSPNITQAVKTASNLGMKVIYLTGSSSPDAEEFCDVVIRVPSNDTQRIQESHILIGHILVEIVETELFMRYEKEI